MTELLSCSMCKEMKPTCDFSKANNTSRGYYAYCKPCRKAYAANNREHIREYGRVRYSTMPERYSNNYYLKAYGITLEEKSEMLRRQGGVCGICKTDDPGGRNGQWVVDHDHACCPGRETCGKCMRSLLCDRCNKSIGLFEDDPSLLEIAAAYLRNTK